MPDILKLLSAIHEVDRRYGKEPINVGSRCQGLMVNNAGEVDLSVPFNWAAPLVVGSKLVWGEKQQPVCVGYENHPTDEYGLENISSLSQHLKVVHKDDDLPSPGLDYAPHRLPPGCQKDVSCCGILIPFLVMRNFKRLLEEECKRSKDDLRLSKIVHGPALTMKTDVSVDGKIVPVSIDISVVIQAGYQFHSDMNSCSNIYWPRQESKWPLPGRIKSIQDKGINVVAHQKPFHWKLSFAELEKDLVKNMDDDDKFETCRKKVHIIMKSVFNEVCGEKPTLSTYMLKNVWLWEYENIRDVRSWTNDRLADRYIGCLRNLLVCVQKGELQQYFFDRINLFEGKDIGHIQENVMQIVDFDFRKNIRASDFRHNIR